MSTPVHRRHPARMDALKLAKQLEIYTIKKSYNDKYFSKKKYRRSLTGEIIRHTKDCYSHLVKAFYCEDKETAMQFLNDAMLSLQVLAAQLDVANTLYETPIPNISFWAEQIEGVKEGIERWMKTLRK